MLVKCVTYYTNDYYRKLAGELSASLSAHGIFHETRKIYAENWKHAVLQKPFFVAGCIESSDADYIIYTDADSKLCRPLGGLPFLWDIAFVPFRRHPSHDDEYLTGTMGFRRCKEVQEFCVEWGRVTEKYKHTDTPEQFALKEMIEHTTLKVERWAPEMCWIFDDSQEIYGKKEPIFEHYQASRQYKTLEKIQNDGKVPAL